MLGSGSIGLGWRKCILGNFVKWFVNALFNKNDEGNKGTPQGVRFLLLKLLENMRGNIMFGKAFDEPTRT